MTTRLSLLIVMALLTVPSRAKSQPLDARAAAAYASREEWWVMNADGCSNYVAEFGKGPPVVVVHGGFGAEHGYLVDAFAGLSSRYKLVFYDQRGSLRSPYKVYEKGGSNACPDSLITLANHVSDLENLRIQLGVEKMTLVAHSMGTFVALSYLQKFPGRVSGLVLISPGVPLKSDHSPALVARQKAAGNSLFERPEIAAETRKAGLDHPNLSDRERIEAWRIRFASANIYDLRKWRRLGGGMAFYNSRAGSAASQTMPKEWNFVELLEKRACPTAVIVGDHDIGDMGARMISEDVRSVSGVRLTVIPDAGHVVWIDQPSAFGVALARGLQLCAEAAVNRLN
ncbi:MAG: alpha/beta fold hydrolase [Gemmatimonadaceae bacterium]